MKPSSTEVGTALYGAWRLMRFDSKAVSYFDKSVDGFWKSFYAAIFWVPVMTIVSFIFAPQLPVNLLSILSMLMSNIAYLFVFPLIFMGVCNVIGWEKNFIGCIVALNWTRVFYVCLLLPVGLIFSTILADAGDSSSVGLVTPGEAVNQPPGFLLLIFLGLALYALAYEVFIYSRSLEISLPAGFGAVVIEMMIALVWSLTHSIIMAVTGGMSGAGG